MSGSTDVSKHFLGAPVRRLQAVRQSGREECIEELLRLHAGERNIHVNLKRRTGRPLTAGAARPRLFGGAQSELAFPSGSRSLS